MNRGEAEAAGVPLDPFRWCTWCRVDLYDAEAVHLEHCMWAEPVREPLPFEMLPREATADVLRLIATDAKI